MQQRGNTKRGISVEREFAWELEAKKGKVQGERQTLKLFIFWGKQTPWAPRQPSTAHCQGSAPISGG